MADNNQNKAEQYRQERKERLAKSAKKNAKNIEKKVAVRSTVKKVIAVIVAVVIALGCLTGILSYCGVLQKAVQVGYVGDEKISYAEYLYYYNRALNQINSNAQYYQYYGYDYGYDTSLSPREQTKTTKDEDGNEVSWLEYIHSQAVDTAQMYLAFYQEAKKAGIELTEADKAAINKQIEELREEASKANQDSNSTDTENQKAGYSLNAYLRRSYGSGVTEGFLKKQLGIEALAKKFYENKTKEFESSYSDEEIKKVFDENPDDYMFVDMRLFQLKNETLTQNDGESDADFEKRQSESNAKIKANATAMYKAVTDEKSFIEQAKKYNTTDDFNAETDTLLRSAASSDLTNYKDIGDWAYADTTKAGDKKLVEDSENEVYYIVLMVNPKHSVDTVTVRHILFPTKDTETQEALSDEEIKKAEENAKKTLADWKNSDKTEDTFASYANDLSEDTGSNTNGGLYENVRPGQMVAEFDSWIFDENRKPGDVDLVETEYGYHIIYFVSKDGAYYDSQIRSTKANEDMNTFSEELLDSDTYIIGVGPRRISHIENKVLDRLEKSLAYSKANGSSSTVS